MTGSLYRRHYSTKLATASKGTLRVVIRFIYFIAIGSRLIAQETVLAQEKDETHQDRLCLEAIKGQARIYKDQRTIDEILQDNASIRAAGEGRIDAVRKALKRGARINSYYLDGCIAFGDDASGSTALMWAVCSGHMNVVKLLIEEKSDLNLPDIGPRHKGNTALYQAVIHEKVEIIELLVKAGAKGNAKEIRLGIALRGAACRGFRIKEGEGYPNYPGYTGDGKGASIEELLNQGADINSADPAGYTPLMYAANLGLVENVKILLARGSDATLKTKNGTTALSLAQQKSSCARAERMQVVELLRSFLDMKK